MDKPRSKLLKRALAAAVATFVLPFVIYFGPQTITYWRLRPVLQRSLNDPPRGWSAVPRSLTDTRTSGEPGTLLSYFGYSVQVPWKEINRERNEGRWADVRFKSGHTVKFFNPVFFDEDPINRSLLHSEVEFDHAFESGVQESKYEQFRDIVSVMPSDLSPFHSRREFARIEVLLDIKGLWFEHNVAVPEILSFETNGYQGFEISGLAQDWQNVSLTFFEDGTNRSYSVLLEGNASSGVRLEQADVNRVIQSFSVVRSR